MLHFVSNTQLRGCYTQNPLCRNVKVSGYHTESKALFKSIKQRKSLPSGVLVTFLSIVVRNEKIWSLVRNPGRNPIRKGCSRWRSCIKLCNLWLIQDAGKTIQQTICLKSYRQKFHDSSKGQICHPIYRLQWSFLLTNWPGNIQTLGWS